MSMAWRQSCLLATSQIHEAMAVMNKRGGGGGESSAVSFPGAISHIGWKRKLFFLAVYHTRRCT